MGREPEFLWDKTKLAPASFVVDFVRVSPYEEATPTG
jgi:hypothetical protein